MTQEGSKTLVVVGVVLGVLMGFACLAGAGFLFFGMRMSSVAAVPVSVPATAIPTPAPVLNIVLPKDGTVFIDGEQIPQAALQSRLESFHIALGDARVVIAADKDLPHGKVVAIIDAVKAAGFTKFAMMVETAPAAEPQPTPVGQ